MSSDHVLPNLPPPYRQYVNAGRFPAFSPLCHTRAQSGYRRDPYSDSRHR
ncbi:Uncharacterised protein [Vibrio cholerae]|nr:Uncharacterised protein [Vibrio cholerae]